MPGVPLLELNIDRWISCQSISTFNNKCISDCNVCQKSAYYHPCNFSRIRKCVSQDTVVTVVHAFSTKPNRSLQCLKGLFLMATILSPDGLNTFVMHPWTRFQTHQVDAWGTNCSTQSDKGPFQELPKLHLLKLQRVQNAATRLILRSTKFRHITPCLYELR